MDPEEGLLVVHEDLAVEVAVLVIGTVGGGLGPERIDVIEGDRALYDLALVLGGRDLYGFLTPVFLLLLLIPGILVDLLDNLIRLAQIRSVNGLIFLGGICLVQIDLRGHEGTVFLDHLANLVLIGEFQTVLIQMQGDLRADLIVIALVHLILGAAVTDPVDRCRPLLAGERVDLHGISHHESGVEAQAEMTDDLILRGLVLILVQKVCRAGEGDLVDVLIYFFSCHPDAVVHEGQGLILGIYRNLYFGLVIQRKGNFSHDV